MQIHHLENSSVYKVIEFKFLSFKVIDLNFSDIQRKAKRWDTKQIDQLKQKRDQYNTQLQDLKAEKRKESELQDLRSQVQSLEGRLKYAQKDNEQLVING